MSEETKVQQNTDEEELLKTVPSILENKFADFTYRFVKYVPMSVHPNVVTGIGLVCGLLGAFCFFLGSFSRWFFIPAIFGVITHIVCDNFDGYMARTRDMQSARGGFLDLMSDILVCTATVLCIGLSSYGHLEIAALGVPLYGIHMVITLHYIMHFNEFPFPPFGPFEIHCTYIVIAVLNAVFGSVTLFHAGSFPFLLDDIILLPAAIGACIEVTRMGVVLFFRLKRAGK